MTEKIHVVLSTFQRAKLLRLCVDSLTQLTPVSTFDLKIRILLNGEDFESEQLLNSWIEKSESQISILKSSKRLSFGAARNALIQSLDSGWIVFIDDDCQLPANYIQVFADLIARFPKAKGFGGPNLGPKNEGIFEATNSLALGSYWGTGPFVKRYRQNSEASLANDRHLILCNLVLKADLNLNFNSVVLGGEENILIRKLIASGNDVVYSSDLFAYHQRRSDWKSLIEQITRYGLGRAEMLKADLSDRQIRLLQLGTLIGLILLTYLGLIHLNIIAMLLSIYLMVNCLVVSAYSVFSVVAFHPVFLFYNFLALHFFYPMGVIKGLLKVNR